MEKINQILSVINIFKDFEINEIIQSLKTYDIKHDENNDLNILLEFSNGINLNYIDKINNFNLKNVGIKIIFNFNFNSLEKNWIQIYLSDYLQFVNDSFLKKSLNRQNFEIKDDNLKIDYITDGEKSLWEDHKHKIIKFIFDKYGFEIKNFLFLKNTVYEEYVKSIDMKLVNNLEQDTKELETKSEQKKYNNFNNYNKNKNWVNEPITPIIEIDNTIPTLNIEGQIFNIKQDVLRNGAYYISYYITDFSSSIIVKKYIADISKYNEELKVNDWVKANISIQSNTGDLTQFYGRFISYIKIDPKIKKTIDSNELKRIEFCLHSKMSAFDGLIDVNDLKSVLETWNHSHFAITDRYNVQSFPEIMKNFKKSNVKPIYGVEMEILPSVINGVLNPIDANISEIEYVVFDIETTGLYPQFDDIIEFGATKVKNNQIVDKTQFFIKPKNPISSKTTELTGIRQEDVNYAIDQKSGLIKIKEYLSNYVIVAHNGINFDLNFINNKLLEYSLEPIKNTLIDTLYISRGINSGFKSHTLESLCKKFKIDYNRDEAHRADYDAVVLSYLWIELIKKLNENNIYLISEINNFIQTESIFSNTKGNFVLVYAKNQVGIRNLYELISISHTDMLYGRPTITMEKIKEFSQNLLVANSPIDSDIFNAAISKDDNELSRLINEYDFITVAPASCFYHEVSSGNITVESIQCAIERIIKLSILNSKKVIAVSNAYYLYESDSEFYELYVNTPTLNRKSHRYLKYNKPPLVHLRTTEQMIDEFSFLNDNSLINDIVINNTIQIASEISFDIKPLQSELFPPKIDGVNEKVENMVYSNAHATYGEELPEIVQKRIEKELNSIIGNGYAVVYWISHLLVQKSINDGYVVGSRGSVGSSLVATFLNITDVNPLQPHYICKNCKHSDFNINLDKYNDGYDLPKKICPNCDLIMLGEGHNIPFETFLGFNGDKVPDIDLNFSGLYQPKAHQFIKDMFGSTHSFRAGTISTIAEKTSFENARSYFEKINKNVSKAEIERYALKCQDVKRTTGQHPGGIIVVPQDMSIFDFTPYNYPADDKTQDWYTTHFAFEYIHDNLLKFDILGHDNPTILKMLKDLTGVDEKDVPNNDEKTMSLFNSLDALGIEPSQINGETTGALSLPEFGTPFVREMLHQTCPKSFSDLIRISGLSHGTDVWIGNANELIKAGHKLDEIIGCRDDIMVYLIQHGIDPLTSFQVMEDVRKGKMIKKEHLEILESNNIPKWYIDSCNKIKYMFPKAHATAYVMHAWKFAWYKLNYPLEYYATYFSIKTDVFNIKVMCEGCASIKAEYDRINKSLQSPKLKTTIKTKDKDLLPLYEIALEMQARGISFKLIDINKSDAKNFIIDKENNTIICPFSSLDGLGEQVAQSIIDARKEKIFISKEDFINRTKVTKQHINLMLELGILDNLKDNNQLSLFDI